MANKTRKRGHGEGSIRQIERTRADGTKYIYYEGRYSTPDGKQKSITDKSKTELTKRLREILTGIDKGEYIEPSKITVKEWLISWLENYKMGEVKPKTIEIYNNAIQNHLSIISDILLKDLRPERIQKLFKELQEKGLSSKTIDIDYVILNSSLRQALINEMIIKNPMEAVTRPKRKTKESTIWNKEQQTAFINSIKSDDYEAVFLLSLYLGMRLGEITGLKWADIDFNNKTLHIKRTSQVVQRYLPKKGEPKTELIFVEPKTEKSKRLLPLPEEITKVLKKHQTRQKKNRLLMGELWQDNDMVFTSTFGEPINPNVITSRFKKAVATAGVSKTNFHNLRHCFCSMALMSGVDLKTVSTLAGHSTITLTADLYSHVLQETKIKAIDQLQAFYKQAK